MPVLQRAEIDEELSKPSVKCKLCRLLDGLEDERPDDAAFLRAMLRAPQAVKGNAHIARVIKGGTDGGVTIGETTIARCRAGHQ